MNLRFGLTVATLLCAATFLAFSIWGPEEQAPLPIRNLRTAQDADAPDGDPRLLPAGWAIPPFDHRLALLSGIERFRVPLADRFDHPLGSAHGALTYNAQPFWAHNEARNGFHTGDDLNGIGGGNSDFGDPVHAIGNALVVYAGEPHPSWGRTLILAHRLPDGRLVQSLYSHLSEKRVTYHQTVARGQIIGKVGNAEGQYLAHLHFELLEANGAALGAGYSQFRTIRRDPSAFVREKRGAADHDLGPSVAEIFDRIRRESLPLPILPSQP
ncbi:M23 family metallopeptidase [Roseibacillus ishigakijimensis]|uniref:M23 family metallopeptidase n=1 Tax=Roseibacillus ishigakijimensis TaxID=454146 RepID=A0A934VM48_9BACT|nr:M23 family metallopeptidase [Roseibacillus ishigakijimensis]MBK1835369.1 M23 family metallopeptidase [Roseibacillus ishigakijimensis]